MPRTITDEEWAFLQNKRRVADLVEPIYDDPVLSKEAKALLKKKYPQMKIDDYDLEERVEQRLAQDKQEREQQEAERRNQQETERFQSIRNKTKQEYGFTDEGMEELEKFMVEKNVGDYDVAAQYMASKKPKTSDASFNDGRWNHDKAPGFAEISKDPEGWGRSEILKSLYGIQERERNQKF